MLGSSYQEGENNSVKIPLRSEDPIVSTMIPLSPTLQLSLRALESAILLAALATVLYLFVYLAEQSSSGQPIIVRSQAEIPVLAPKELELNSGDRVETSVLSLPQEEISPIPVLHFQEFQETLLAIQFLFQTNELPTLERVSLSLKESNESEVAQVAQPLFQPEAETLKDSRFLFFHEKLTRLNVEKSQRNALAGLIIEKSDQFGVDPFLVGSLTFVESSFRPDAVSAKNYIGLLQIDPKRLEELGELTGMKVSASSELFKAEENMMLGVGNLALLLEMMDGDIARALSAYHRDIEGARLLVRGEAPTNEEKNFAEKVIELSLLWREEFRTLRLLGLGGE